MVAPILDYVNRFFELFIIFEYFVKEKSLNGGIQAFQGMCKINLYYIF